MSQSRLGDRTMVEAVSVGTDGLLQTRTLSRSSDRTEDHVAGLSHTIDSSLVSLCLRRMRSTDMSRAPEVLTHSAPHLTLALGLDEDTVGCCERLHFVLLIKSEVLFKTVWKNKISNFLYSKKNHRFSKDLCPRKFKYSEVR